MVTVNNRDKVEWQPGMTVRKLLDTLGHGRALITVTVNDAVVTSDDYDTYAVPDHANVTVFHLAHGG